MAAPNENSTAPAPAAGTTRPSEFPSAITYAEISAKHPDYRADLIERYEDLYCGGEQFRKNIEQYLDQRQIENPKAATAPIDTSVENVGVGQAARNAFHGMNNRWEERKRVSRYTNLVAGILDYFVSAVFNVKPEIISEDTSPYWKNLNNNADGLGTPLPLLLRNAAIDHLKHFRTFLAVQGPGGQFKHQTEQKNGGGFDAMLRVLCARDVDMWQEDGAELKWIRTYRKDVIREAPIGPATKVRELWTYITETDFVEYEIKYDKATPPSKDAVVACKSIKRHGFPRLPVVPLKIHQGLWAMQRMEEPALKVFNREASLTWYLNSIAFQILTIVTDKPIDQIVDVSVGALNLGPGGSASFTAPQPGAADALFKDWENGKTNMYEVFQSIGLNAVGTQTQNARQSAEAKVIDRQPLSAMLTAYASGIRTAVEAAARLIAEFRAPIAKDAPAVLGLDYCDVLTLDQKVKNIIDVQSIKGYPETAYREQLANVALALTPTASAEAKTAILKEARDADLDGAATINGNPANAPATDDGQIGKIPLALQQLALTRQRFVETADAKRAETVGRLMDELIDSIDVKNLQSEPVGG